MDRGNRQQGRPPEVVAGAGAPAANHVNHVFPENKQAWLRQSEHDNSALPILRQALKARRLDAK
jgi:hypothetical protein